MTTHHVRPEKMAQGHADSLALSPRHTGVHNGMADLEPMLASFTAPSFPVCTMHQQHQPPPESTEMSLESPPQTYCLWFCILIRSICTFVSTSSLAHVAYEEHWLTLTHVPDLGPQNLGAQHSWEPATLSRKTGLAQWRWCSQGGHLERWQRHQVSALRGRPWGGALRCSPNTGRYELQEAFLPSSGTGPQTYLLGRDPAQWLRELWVSGGSVNFPSLLLLFSVSNNLFQKRLII